MAGEAQINSKARLAVAALILILIFPAVMLLRNLVDSTGSEKFVPPASVDLNEIVQIGGATMLLEQGSIGSRIIEWHSAGSTAAHAVEVADAIFQHGSRTPTPDGRVRIRRFAQLMTAHPGLIAKIVVPARVRVGAQQFSLLRERARQLRSELIASGVADSRVQVTQILDAANDGSSSIVVVLSRQGG